MEMKPFYAADGTLVTEEALEQLAAPWDEGEIPGTAGPVTPGRPRLSSEPTQTVTFKAPESSVKLISAAARSMGTSRSNFIREAVVERARRVLSM